MIGAELMSLLAGGLLSCAVFRNHIIVAVITFPSLLGYLELSRITVSENDIPKSMLSWIFIVVFEFLFGWVVGWLYIPVIIMKGIRIKD